MTTTFFLLRHAAHDDVGSYLAGRTPYIFLGPEGRAQAARLAERMRRESFAAIVSSPRERTQETAQAIAGGSRIGSVQSCDDLDEIDFGRWSGKTFVELNRDPDWRRWNDCRAHAITPAGESMEHVRERVWGCMSALSKTYEGEGVILVSHADVIKSAICHILDVPTENSFRFDIEPASVSIAVMGDWGAKLILLNESVS